MSRSKVKKCDSCGRRTVRLCKSCKKSICKECIVEENGESNCIDCHFVLYGRQDND